jgi:hypothetical protein
MLIEEPPRFISWHVAVKKNAKDKKAAINILKDFGFTFLRIIGLI